MAIIEIHGKQVHIDDHSESAKYAAKYLENLDHGEAKNYFKTASTDRYSHFETPRHGTNSTLQHDMTLEHRGDGTYALRKRTLH